MAKIVTFTDTIKATSENDAVVQVYRLYPNAIDVELISRETADGTRSPNGRYFNFEITLEQRKFELDDDDLVPEELGEDKY